MNIFELTYQTGEVAAATGVTNQDIQNWVKRELLHGADGEEIGGAGSPGRYRRFTFRTVMLVACAKALMDANLGEHQPAAAFATAMHFAFSSTGGHSWGDGPVVWDQPRRIAGLPFARSLGSTVLAAAGDRHVIMAVDWTKPDVLRTLRGHLRSKYGFVHVDMSNVFDMTVSKLGLKPDDILNLAYPESAVR